MMEAGRELDALVAEKVMGWRFRHEWKQCPNERARQCVRCQVTEWVSESAAERCEGFPNYSTRMADAWEIVERINLKPAQGIVTIAVSRLAAHPKYSYECEIQERIYDESGWANPARFTVNSTAPTAPLAICLAALKAVAP